MKTKKILLFIAVMVYIISCTPKNTTTVDKDKALADSLLQINVDAYNSGDAQKIADMFTDDCLNLTGNDGIWGKDTVLASAKSIVAYIKGFKAYLGTYSVTKDMVIMEKYFTVDIAMGEKTTTGRGLATLIWIKQPDSSWKIALEEGGYSIKP
jgi:ketosteroid isomerase-like protein